MNESGFWAYVKKGMAERWIAIRVENYLSLGTPDVWYSFKDRRSGWIELKYIPKYPKGVLNIRHLTRYQQHTLKLIDYYSMAWLFLKAGKQYFLIQGKYADQVNGKTENELYKLAMNYWEERINFDSLSGTLQGIFC